MNLRPGMSWDNMLHTLLEHEFGVLLGIATCIAIANCTVDPHIAQQGCDALDSGGLPNLRLPFMRDGTPLEQALKSMHLTGQLLFHRLLESGGLLRHLLLQCSKLCCNLSLLLFNAVLMLRGQLFGLGLPLLQLLELFLYDAKALLVRLLMIAGLRLLLLHLLSNCFGDCLFKLLEHCWRVEWVALLVVLLARARGSFATSGSSCTMAWPLVGTKLCLVALEASTCWVMVGTGLAGASGMMIPSPCCICNVKLLGSCNFHMMPLPSGVVPFGCNGWTSHECASRDLRMAVRWDPNGKGPAMNRCLVEPISSGVLGRVLACRACALAAAVRSPTRSPTRTMPIASTNVALMAIACCTATLPGMLHQVSGHRLSLVQRKFR